MPRHDDCEIVATYYFGATTIHVVQRSAVLYELIDADGELAEKEGFERLPSYEQAHHRLAVQGWTLE